MREAAADALVVFPGPATTAVLRSVAHGDADPGVRDAASRSLRILVAAPSDVTAAQPSTESDPTPPAEKTPYSSRFEKDEAPEERDGHADGFLLGVSMGASFCDREFCDQIGPGGVLAVTLGARLKRYLGVEVEGDVAVMSNEFDSTVMWFAAKAGLRGFVLGGKRVFDPSIAAHAGWFRGMIRDEGSADALQAVDLDVGVALDFNLTPHVSIGPEFQAIFPVWTKYCSVSEGVGGGEPDCVSRADLELVGLLDELPRFFQVALAYRHVF